MKQILFAISLFITLGVFAFTVNRLVQFFKFTRPAFPIRDFGKRFRVMLDVAFGQTKIFRKPVIGFFHALVFWGFCVILIGSIEMVIDGLTGTERALRILGVVYNVIVASGDVFGLIVAISILIFLSRRLFFHISRFEGAEMKYSTHIDANIALSMILLLMVSLLGMNSAYVAGKTLSGEVMPGIYPVSRVLSSLFMNSSAETAGIWYEVFWWSHILLIFCFANMLPYSKHFHVFMSVPNVFLSRLGPLGKLTNMDSITREVKLMMNPDTAFAAQPADTPVERFGVKDVEDVTWKNYFMMDVRSRMNEKGPGLVKNGKEYSDSRSLLHHFITETELWACTTCNACAMECPININHPSLIVDMRRYLVMEEGAVPGELKSVFSNIENNGAPWQFSPEDRLLWAKDLELKVH
jgi:nitrate reductase gamma subunit